MSLVFVPGVAGLLFKQVKPSEKPPTEGSVPDFDFCEKDSPIVGFHVQASSHCNNYLKWCLLDGAEADSFQIYKSFIGFVTDNEAPFNLRKGDSLKLKINNDTLQKVIFTKDHTAEELVELLNEELDGVEVSKMADTDQLIFRSKKAGERAFVEIYGGSAVSKMGIDKRIIGHRSEFVLWATVPGNGEFFEDTEGDINDYYQIKMVYDSDIYRKTYVMKPTAYTDDICVVEGFLYNADGTRSVGVEVTAKLVLPPEYNSPGGVLKDQKVSCHTDEHGRFALPVLQGARITFIIDKAQMSSPVQVPEQSFVFFDKLDIYEDYKFKDL